MAVRFDITVDFSASPRIVTVAAPSTEVNLQDLYDTLRNIEATETGILYPQLLNAAGKQVLGGGALVGMTLTLRNALLSFEARTGPMAVLCQVSGGNLVAVDADGVPLPSPLQPTAYAFAVMTQSTSASLLSGTGGLTKEDVRSAVWDSSSVFGTFGDLLNFLFRFRKNRMVTEPGNANNMVLYGDDGQTVLMRWNVSGPNGEAIIVPTGAAAQRSDGVAGP
jgi:hypothetical protein